MLFSTSLIHVPAYSIKGTRFFTDIRQNQHQHHIGFASVEMKSLIVSSILLAASVQAAASGEFTALSFNVAGLPSILQSNDVEGDKTDNAGQLGKYFSEYGYDIINMQEVPSIPFS